MPWRRNRPLLKTHFMHFCKSKTFFFEGLPFVHYTERFDHDIALAKNTLKKAFRLPSQNLILFGLYLQHRTFALKEHSLPFAAKKTLCVNKNSGFFSPLLAVLKE